jgi:hypothetical protein
MGNLGVGIMNSTAFSLSANNSSQVDEIQIPFGTIDFQPHQSSFTQVFESMDQDIDLTIGSLNFRVGSLGSIRLSDPMRTDLSASEPEIVAMSESSKSSSSEVNSPVSLAETKEGKITGGDEIMENSDLGVQPAENKSHGEASSPNHGPAEHSRSNRVPRKSGGNHRTQHSGHHNR